MTSYGTYTPQQQSLIERMRQNSIDWWDADEAGRTALHDENIRLAQQLEGLGVSTDYADKAGAWTLNGAQGSQPSYTDRYAEDIATLTRALLERDPFSYDLSKDPLYGYYADTYERNGERAMKDTLGQLAARTGGLASSWAGTQAQQAYQNYMLGLNDVVPELYRLAYSMYQDDEDYQRKNLEMLRTLEQGDYGKFLDTLGQWNTDRSFDYGVSRDAVSDQQNAFANLMALAQLGGGYGDYGYLGSLGITPNPANVAEMTTAGSASLLKQGGGGGGGRKNSGGDGDSAETENDFWSQVEDYVTLGGDATDYIKKNWKSTGLFASQTAALSAWNVYKTHGASLETERADEADKRNVPSATRQGTNGIPVALIDEINRDAEGGMSEEALYNKIIRWIEDKKITEEQGNWLAESFGY